MLENNENKKNESDIYQIILTALSSGDKFDDEILHIVESKIGTETENFVLSDILTVMIENGLIKSYSQEEDNSNLDDKQYIFSITDEGQKFFELNDMKLNKDISQYLFSDESTINDINKTQQKSAVSSDPKKIISENNDSKDSFVQFDLFNQNIKMIKTSSAEEHKFSPLESNYKLKDEEIEPNCESKEVANNASSVNNGNNNKDLENSSKSISWDKELKEQNKAVFEADYRSSIGRLYNNSQIKDPYEQNKYQTFKEIFPSSQLKEKDDEEVSDSEMETNNELDAIVESSSNSNINCDDIKMLNNLYNLQGISIKVHNDIENKKQRKAYTDKNRLSMATGLFITFVMLFEIIATYFILKEHNMVIQSQTIIYFLAASLALAFGLIAILENIFDRFKLVIIEKPFSKSFIPRLLIFIILAIITFSVNVAVGMTNLMEVDYLSYWLIPILISSNVILYTIVYHLLLKSRHFNS